MATYRERVQFVRDQNNRVRETYRESWVGGLSPGVWGVVKVLLTSPLRAVAVAWRGLSWLDMRFPVLGLTFWSLLFWYHWPSLVEIAENVRQ